MPRFYASCVTLFDLPTELICYIIFWVSIKDYKFCLAFSSSICVVDDYYIWASETGFPLTGAFLVYILTAEAFLAGAVAEAFF